MALLNIRHNIIGMCRTRELWTGKISAGDTLGREGQALTGIKPSTWSEQSSDTTERSFLVDEGEHWRNIPHNVFNILQASLNDPVEVTTIVHEQAPDVNRKFELDEIETGTMEWYVELVDALAYLSIDRYDDYAKRYWYNPWRKARENNPDLLDEGYFVIHPGKDAEPEEEVTMDTENVESASEANW